jgi:hypothetical protein
MTIWALLIIIILELIGLWKLKLKGLILVNVVALVAYIGGKMF